MSGPLQISAGYPWQDVSPGSVMWRMFRGWNERRMVCGLSILQYAGSSFDAASDIDSAIIEPGANLQSAAFWRALQTNPFESLVRANDDGTTYAIALGTAEVSGATRTMYDARSIDVDNRYGVAISAIAGGDQITAETINAILRRMYAYRDVHVRGGSTAIIDRQYFFLPNPSGAMDDLISPLFLGIHVEQTGIGEQTASGMPVLRYAWPESLLGSPAVAVGLRPRYGERFGTAQSSLSHAYDFSAPSVATGMVDWSDVIGITRDSWDSIGGLESDFTTVTIPEGTTSAWYYALSTCNLIISPRFADLEP